MKIRSKPEVFIIESLDFGDEEDTCREGEIISSILGQSGKNCKYFYIRTKAEFEEVIEQFAKSKYRYLHLSMHGNKDGKHLHTTLDKIPFSELSRIVKPHLKNRRVFLSTCVTTNHRMAQALMPSSGCRSILGPVGDLEFRHAAILWASLYHVMFTADQKMMKQSVLREKAQEVADMFRVHLNYIRKDTSEEYDYEMEEIRPKQRFKKKPKK